MRSRRSRGAFRDEPVNKARQNRRLVSIERDKGNVAEAWNGDRWERREEAPGRQIAASTPASSGSGGLAPIAYGVIADRSSRSLGVLAAAGTAAAIIPMVLALRPFLKQGVAEP